MALWSSLGRWLMLLLAVPVWPYLTNVITDYPFRRPAAASPPARHPAAGEQANKVDAPQKWPSD